MILLMSVAGAAFAGPPPPPLNLLMDGPHWRVGKAGLPRVDFCEFFRALADIAPSDSFLALADGAWDGEIRDAVSLAAADLGDPLPAIPVISGRTP